MSEQLTNKQLIKQKKIKHFKESDFQFDVDLLHPKLLLLIDQFKSFLKKDIVILDDKFHSPESYHCIIPERDPRIMAIDIFPLCPLIDALYLVFRFKFGGVGIYPYYEYEDFKSDNTKYGKIHLDIRPWKLYRNVWMENHNKKLEYINTNDQFLKLLKIINK